MDKKGLRDYGDMLLGVLVYVLTGGLLLWLAGWVGLIVILHGWSAHVLLRGKDTYGASETRLAHLREQANKQRDDAEPIT